MKKLLTLSAIALLSALAGITSCKSDKSTAAQVAGEWCGTPVRMDRNTVDDGTFTPVFSFQLDKGARGGAVTLSAQLSVTMPVNAPVDSLGASVVSATAAGQAVATGTWRVDDGDEVKLIFNPSTLKVTFDPDVQFEVADVFTNYDVPEGATVPNAVKRAFVDRMTRGMQKALTELDELDDIHIEGVTMKCKMLGSRRILSRPD